MIFSPPINQSQIFRLQTVQPRPSAQTSARREKTPRLRELLPMKRRRPRLNFKDF